MADRARGKGENDSLRAVADRLPAPVRAVTRHGATMMISFMGARNVVRLGSNLVLTRLLTPEAFGVVGVIVSINYVLAMLSDMGFTAYLVRHKREDPHFLSVIWTIRLARSLAMSLVLLFGAGLFAAFFKDPQLAPAIMASAGLPVLGALSSLAPTVALRHQRVPRISFIEFVEHLLGVIVTIAAAVWLRSYWAIIVGMYFNTLVKIYASYRLFGPSRVGPAFDREIARDMWRFARVVIPSSIITLILMQTDKIFMARYFPMAELGLFMLAVSLAEMANQVTGQYNTRILYPLLAKAERRDGDDPARHYYASRRRLFLFFAFGLGGLMAGGELVIRILFDDRYLGAAAYLSIVAIRPLLKLTVEPAQRFLVAKGYVKATLHGNVIRLVWFAALGPAAYVTLGPVGVVAALMTAEAPVAVYNWFKLRRYGALNWREEGWLALAALLGAGLGWGANAAVNALIGRGVIPAF
ncbi:MAG: hypothetical protein Kow00133_07500 [Amphiplicatus sp.]